MSKQTDNHNLPAKLDLRRHFLRKYHADRPPRVIDCCQGNGVIWGVLRREFPLASYWGLDVKPRKGRLKLASERVLAQPGWSGDIIDIDTYGSPWGHWNAMLPNLTLPATVFLTIGTGGPNMIRVGRPELEAMGITIEQVFRLSGAITRNLFEKSLEYILDNCRTVGKMKVSDAVEAVSTGNARYIGVRLENSRGTNHGA